MTHECDIGQGIWAVAAAAAVFVPYVLEIGKVHRDNGDGIADESTVGGGGARRIIIFVVILARAKQPVRKSDGAKGKKTGARRGKIDGSVYEAGLFTFVDDDLTS